MHRFLPLAVLAAFSQVVSGCAYVARDLRATGGAVGSVLDDRMFDASKSKELVLLRSAILIAMVARAGTVYARDQRDADAYVNYLVAATDEINILAGHIYPDRTGLACSLPDAQITLPPADGIERTIATLRAEAASARQSATEAEDSARRSREAEQQVRTLLAGAGNAPAGSPAAPATLGQVADKVDDNDCYTYAVNFESDVPMLERRLFRLAMAALPQEQAKRFLDQVTKGDALGAALAAFSFASKSFDGLHSGAAVHRTGLEIVAGQHVDCTGKSRPTVYDAAYCMSLPVDRLFVGKHDTRDSYDGEVSREAFFALMRNIRDSCRMVPLGIQGSEVSLDAVRNNRIALCDSIQFLPRSRWESQAQLDQARPG